MLKPRNLLLILSLFTISVFSQETEKLDKLLNKANELNGKAQVDILINISKKYGYQSFSLSEKYAREAEAKAKVLNLDTSLITIYRLLGASKQYQNQLDSAIYFFNQSIDYSRKIKDKKEIARSLSNLGAIYAQDGQYDKAEKIYLSSLETLEPLQDTVSILQIYNNLGMIYHLKHESDKSVLYYKKALSKTDTNSLEYGIRISNLAEGLFYKGDIDFAVENYLKAINIFENKDSKYNIAFTYYRMAKLYHNESLNEKAKLYCLQAIDIAQSIHAMEILLYTNKLLSDIERSQKNYKLALKYQDSYIVLKDSVNTIKRDKLLNELEIQYQVELKNSEIKRKTIEIQSKSNFLRLSIIGIILALILITLLLIQIKKLKQAYADLAKQNMNFVSVEEELTELKEEIYLNKEVFNKPPKEESELIDQILDLVENKKVFLETDLTIFKFADELGTNKTYVSQEINTRFNKNFSNFINEYRVAEARRLMTLSENHNLTLAAIANKSGFNSVSVFNRSFKRVTGITPSIYLKSVKESK